MCEFIQIRSISLVFLSILASRHFNPKAFSLSLSFTVSVFSLSFVICLRTRALVALRRGGLSPATAAAMVRGEKGFGDSERAAQIGVGISGFVLMGWALAS